MTDKKNIKKQVRIWYTLGRIAPLGALFLLCVAIFFDLNSIMEWILSGVATLFACIAFAWWWWVLDTVRALFSMLEHANNKFKEILDDLTSIKQDINDNTGKRNKSKKTKPKSSSRN